MMRTLWLLVVSGSAICCHCAKATTDESPTEWSRKPRGRGHDHAMRCSVGGGWQSSILATPHALKDTPALWQWQERAQRNKSKLTERTQKRHPSTLMATDDKVGDGC